MSKYGIIIIGDDVVMKKLMRCIYMICIVLFFIIFINVKSSYALSETDVKSLKSGDYLEVTKASKVYYYGETTSAAGAGAGVSVKKLQIMPGYEDTDKKKPRIAVGTKLQVMPIDQNSKKCYIEQNGTYYVSVNWGQIDCYIHYSNVKSTSLSKEQKEKIDEFLKRSTAKKALKNASELKDDDLIKLAEDGHKIFIETGDQRPEDVVQAAELELQKRGYTYKNNSDGSVEILDKNGNVVGSTVGGDLKDASTIYKLPKKEDQANAGASLDDMISDGQAFTENGTVTYDQTKLTNVSNAIYNILLTVGVIMAVLVGAILGIKLMVSGVEQKVEAKKLLIPYVAGCIVIFGGFGIWKLVVTILQGI